jgi:hypothetical protein
MITNESRWKGTMERRLDYQDIDTITPAPNNPKEHQIDRVRASIDRFGYVAPMILDDRTGRLVVGHGRLESLKARRDAGETPPEGIQVDDTGRWLAPVIHGWSSRSDADAAAYLVLDNRQTELGGWDHQALADLLEEIGDPDLIELTGWDPADLEELLDSGDGDDIGGADPDSAPCPSAEVSRFGDIWILGRHRLLCGDSTNTDDIDRLMDGVVPGIVCTDPPYGIRAVPKDGGVSRGGRFGGAKGKTDKVKATAYRQVHGDENTDVARDSFALVYSLYPDAAHAWWGGNHYAESAKLPDSSCWLVWDKDNQGNDFADAELAWTNHRGAVRLLRHKWNGLLRDSERGAGQRFHPTQKPVALMEWVLEQIDRKSESDTVFDPFGGSGSTLIAAHRSDRTAYIIEIDPYYVDLICKRFQELTGVLPERVLDDGSRERHDFTSGSDDDGEHTRALGLDNP